MPTKDVEQRFKDAWDLSGRLSSANQTRFRAQLLALRKAATPRTPSVSGPSDEWDWDLALANKLDGIWKAVTDQAGQVYGAVKTEAGKAVDATAASAAKLGIGLVPLALVVVAVLYFYGNTNKGRA